MTTPTLDQRTDEDLVGDIERVMSDFSRTVGDLFVHLGDIRRPTDLQKRLGIGPALAWGVYRAATHPSPIEASLQIPGSGAMRTFFRALSDQRIDEQTIANVEHAFEQFDEIRERNGGLQNGFATLVSDLADIEDPKEALRQQRAAFRANGHLWGLQAAGAVNLKLICPGEGNCLDLVSVHGMHGLTKLRRSAVLRTVFASTPPADIPGQTLTSSIGPASSGRVQALEMGEPGEFQGSGLLVDFCTKPLPIIEFGKGENSPDWWARVQNRRLGANGATSFFVGYRELAYFPLAQLEPTEDFSMIIKVPAELLIYDVLVHAQAAARVDAQLGIFGSRSAVSGKYIYHEDSRLPCHESARCFDRADRAPCIAAFPRHTELMQRACAATGHSIESFRLVRVVLKYPVLHSFIRLQLQIAGA